MGGFNHLAIGDGHHIFAEMYDNGEMVCNG
jgi:hypothetical protein